MAKEYKVPAWMKKRRSEAAAKAKKKTIGATQKGKPSKVGTDSKVEEGKGEVKKASTAKKKPSKAGKALAASALAEAVRRRVKKGKCTTAKYKGKKVKICDKSKK